MNSVPIRKCISCGIRKPKMDFIMVVKSPRYKESVSFRVLPGRNKPEGRAAYICSNNECLEKARKTKRLEKSFRMKIDGDIYNLIEKEIKNYD